jgi:hypothetical protein
MGQLERGMGWVRKIHCNALIYSPLVFSAAQLE